MTMTRKMELGEIAEQTRIQTHTSKESCREPRANIMAWTWASDKCCRTCVHYDGQYCNIDDKRYGENYYCSSWRP